MHLSTKDTVDISNQDKHPLSSHTSLVYLPLRAAAMMRDALTRVSASSVAPVIMADFQVSLYENIDFGGLINDLKIFVINCQIHLHEIKRFSGHIFKSSSTKMLNISVITDWKILPSTIRFLQKKNTMQVEGFVRIWKQQCSLGLSLVVPTRSHHAKSRTKPGIQNDCAAICNVSNCVANVDTCVPLFYSRHVCITT